MKKNTVISRARSRVYTNVVFSEHPRVMAALAKVSATNYICSSGHAGVCYYGLATDHRMSLQAIEAHWVLAVIDL